MTTTISLENYFDDEDFLSNSRLSNFVSFDIYGNPTYNIQEFLNPTKPSSSAITVGTLCDRILTEGFDLDSEYGPTLDVAGMKNQLDLMGVEYKSAATKPILRAQLANAGYKFLKELGKDERTAIETIVWRARNFQYDEKTTFMEFIAESDCQKICVSDDWGVKGKFDFLNKKRGVISDLKTTGNLERTMKELTFQGKPNVFHKYVRQLAIYQHLYYLESGERFRAELIFIDYKGNHRIVRIGQRALDRALKQVMEDIEVLRDTLLGKRPYNIDIDIDDAMIQAIDTHTAPVMETVVEIEQEATPDYLMNF